MSDHLKKFIQQSRSKFEIEKPRADLFDKILIQVNKPHKKEFNLDFKWAAIAATIALLIISSLIFYNGDINKNKNDLTTTVKPIPQNHNNNNPSSLEKVTIKQLPEIKNDHLVLNNSLSGKEINNNFSKHFVNVKSSPNQVQFSESFNEKTPIQNPEPKTEIIKPAWPAENSMDPLSIAENGIENEISPERVIVSTMPEGGKMDQIPNGFQKQKSHQNATEIENNTIVSEQTEESQSLKSAIKKGFFNLLSRKAKKWSGNTLSIENVEINEHPVLAVHFKNEKFEISKQIKLGNTED